MKIHYTYGCMFFILYIRCKLSYCGFRFASIDCGRENVFIWVEYISQYKLLYFI